MRPLCRLALLGALLLGSQNAVAANTGGVFGPTVNAGHRSWQGRAAHELDEHGFSSRLHYQQSINGELMWRLVGQVRKTEDAVTDWDFAQAELFWQLSEDGADWQTGVRLDLRIRGNDRPEQFGVNWTNQMQLAPKLEGRFAVLLARNFGNQANSDVSFQTRGHLSYAVSSKVALGVELFNSYGAIDNVRDFDDQQHQIGPFVTVRLDSKWRLFTGALFGVTDRTSDAELRLWLTRTL